MTREFFSPIIGIIGIITMSYRKECEPELDSGAPSHSSRPRKRERESVDSTANLITGLDLTVWCNQTSEEELLGVLRDLCSKWVYQKEAGKENGTLHYQVRCRTRERKSLSVHRTIFGKRLPGSFIRPTAKDTHQAKNFNYVMKEDTRVAPPVKESDSVANPPPLTVVARLMRGRTLYPWQTTLKEIMQKWYEREIHLLYDPNGNLGKSAFIELMEYEGYCYDLPAMNSMEDVMQAVMCIGYRKCFTIDMPKSICKKHLQGMYSGLEILKNGVAYDKRYTFRKIRMERPTIIVFTNCLPDFSWLSMDRWKIWVVEPNFKNLVPYDPDNDIFKKT